MGLTIAGFAGPSGTSELILRNVEERALRVLSGVTNRWCQPPVLDLSRTEVASRDVEVESTGLSSVDGRSVILYFTWATVGTKTKVVALQGRVSEGSANEVSVEEHLRQLRG